MGFELIPFADLLSDVVDNRGRTCPTADTGIPLIATNCISNDLLYPTYEKARFVSQDTYTTWFRCHPEPGDILFVNKATPGRVCLVPDPVDFCIAQDMVALRADPKKIYPKYLFAALRSPTVQGHIARMHVGTLIPHFKKGDFDKLPIPVPSPGEQRFIGDTYFDLSAKIDLNRRMSETLEAIARAIFKSWFVDFDPARAKMKGRQPFGMPAEIASLFPASLVDSGPGPIPTGWRVVPLGDEFDYTMGQSPPGVTYNEEGKGMPLYQGKGEFGFRFPSRRLFCTSPTRFAESGDTLVSVRAPVGAMNMAREKCCVGRGLAAVRHKSGSRSYTYYLLQEMSEAFAAYDAEGTVFGSINKKAFGSIPCLKVPDRLVEELENALAPIDSMIEVLEDEQTTLADIRDTLLPKLISGEIRIKDAS